MVLVFVFIILNASQESDKFSEELESDFEVRRDAFDATACKFKTFISRYRTPEPRAEYPDQLD